MTASPLFESRFPVGSSASRMTGSPATARATATRCCCPPESWLGRCLARCAMPTRPSADQVEALKDESDFTIADARPLRSRELGDGTMVQFVGAPGWRVEQPENREKRRFAAAGWPADRHVLAAGDVQVHVRQGVRFHFVGGENLREVLQFD